MKFRATATPKATPTPADDDPTPTAIPTAPITASISELLRDRTLTLPTRFARLPISLLAMKAFVFVRITLVDSAPPPLTATPALPETPAAMDAANEIASTAALLLAATRMSP